jgi:hypothetical protein
LIVEIVRFMHPPGTSRADILAGAEATLERWRANSELVRKLYLCSTDQTEGIGIYFWPSVEAARCGHDAAWIAQAEQRSGAPVRIEYHELLMELDNQAGTVTRHPA